MGVISNVVGKIFGTDKALETVSNGVDKAFFTKEEQAEHFLDLLKAYEPFKLIQRVLASMVTAVYLAVWVGSAIIYVSSLFFEPCAGEAACTFAQFQEVSKDLAEMNNDTLGLPFATIMALYFGGGALEGVIRARK